MSNISCGIVGLPNVGKSTLFNALTNNNALVANYPFATIEPNTGIVPIPDPRLGELAKIYNTQKVVPATVTFVDIAGLVAGASEGQGLGNQFLAHIRSTNAICQVVRAFSDSQVTHVSDKLEPAGDVEIINTELALADLQTVQNRLPKLEKEARTDSKLQPLLSALKAAQDKLDKSKLLVNELSQEDKLNLKDLQLITSQPIIYVFNVDEGTLANKTRKAQLQALVSPTTALFLCAKLEDELRGLDASDAAELLKSYGQSESGLIQLIHEAYAVLGLQSFLTAGEKEVRAWTIKKGATAPEAAGAIHSDFQRGFIAAQVVGYQDLISSGSLAAAKAAGKVRTEGKDYIMRPDDVVEFRFNV